MKPDLSTREAEPCSFIVPEDVLMREVEGEAVLLDLASEKYFGLDEIGTHMWRALTGSIDREAALASLMDEFEVEPDRLAADFDAFGTRLVDLGLLEPRRA